jgi:hypothetical protein
VLAVGAAQFQRKCIDVFHALKRQRKTIVLVSHDLSSVQRFCDYVVWLDKGKVAAAGEANEVVQTYLMVSQGAHLDTPALESQEGTEHRWGDGKVRFTDVNLTDERGEPVSQVAPWTRLVLRTTIVANAAVEAPVFGMLIWLAGQLVYSVNTRMLGMTTGSLRAGEQRQVDIHFTPALINGRYRISVAAAAEMDGGVYDWLNHATALLVVGGRCGDGVCDLGAEFDFDGSPHDLRTPGPGGSVA